MYQTVYQPCTKSCIKHVSYHQPCTKMYHEMFLNHIPYHSWYVSIIPYTMYHKILSMKCLNKVPKHVLRSPTSASNHAPYHQPYTSNNMPIIHRPCTIICTKQLLSMVYLNQVPISSRGVSYTCANIYQVWTSTLYQHHKDMSLIINHNHEIYQTRYQDS